MRLVLRVFLSVVLLVSISPVFSSEFVLPASGDLVGKVQFYQVKPGDSFATIGQKFDVGYDALTNANPRVDSEKPLPGAVLIIPSRFILPKIRQGIIVNVAHMLLYYFPQAGKNVFVFPVGVGQENWDTPIGVMHIAQKIKNPVWIVPDSIMKFRKKHGDPVSKIMQSGPDNPLGYFAMRLSIPTYLIHGTSEPDSIGRRSSAGCVHLFRKDIKQLFAMTPVGTPVRIVNQPYVLGWEKHKLYLSSRPVPVEKKVSVDMPIDAPPSANPKKAPVAGPVVQQQALAQLKKRIQKMVGKQKITIDWDRVAMISKQWVGLPQVVGS